MLVDTQIRKLCTVKQPLVTPYDPSLVGPHCLVLRVGEAALFGAPHTAVQFPNIRKFPLPGSKTPKSWVALDLKKYTEEDPWSIEPRWLVLVKTMENLLLPSTVTAQVALTPAMVLNGYGMSSPQFVDSDMPGSLTLAILNLNSYNTLPLFPGMPIAQIVFTRTRYRADGSVVPILTMLPVHEGDIRRV